MESLAMLTGIVPINAQKFDLNEFIAQTTRRTTTTTSIDPDVYKLAESIVVDKLTNPTGKKEEIENHNQLLQNCAAGDPSAQIQVKAMIRTILTDEKLVPAELIDMYAKEIYIRNYGLGAIDDLDNEAVNEIWVNGAESVWIEKGGFKQKVDVTFESDEEVIRVIRQMIKFDNETINKSNPIVECRRLNGDRLTCIIPPAGKRPYINIRKFNAFDPTTENLIKEGTVTPEMVDYIKTLVRGRANIIVIGETGSGKTSTLKWMIDFIDPKLRIGTIESSFELKLDEKYGDTRNIFSYEENERLGITLLDLFKTCLRSTPDIIIMGEARGEEADELIKAMRRGHPGSIGTIHSSAPDMVVDDIAAMIEEDGRTRDPVSLRRRIAGAINIIVQMRRFEDGKRRMTKITEVRSDPITGEYDVVDIFSYEVDPDDPSKGEFVKLNNISDRLKRHLNYYGIPANVLDKM